MVRDITEAVLDAEQGAYERDPCACGYSRRRSPTAPGAAVGRIVTLADIATFATGDAERGRLYAEERLAQRRGAPAIA